MSSQAPLKALDDETVHLIPRVTPKRSRFEHWPLDLARSRLLGLERHIERRYLLPPLNSAIQLDIVPDHDDHSVVANEAAPTPSALLPDGNRSLGDSVDAETESESGFGGGPGSESTTASLKDAEAIPTGAHRPQIRRVVLNKPSCPSSSSNPYDMAHLGGGNIRNSPISTGVYPADIQDSSSHYLFSTTPVDSLLPGLVEWRHSLHRATDVSQLRGCMEQLVAAIAWDKSIMKVVSALSVCCMHALAVWAMGFVSSSLL